MKRFAIALSVGLTLLTAAPALAAPGQIMEKAGSRISAEITSATVYVDRMPCAGTCVRKSVIVVTLKNDCYIRPKATVTSVAGSTATVKVTAAKPKGPRLCSTEPQRVRVTVPGSIDRVIDAATGIPVDTTSSVAQ